MLFMLRVFHHIMSVHCRHRSTAGKELTFDSLVFDVFLCFCHIPMWCPCSGLVLDCISS